MKLFLRLAILFTTICTNTVKGQAPENPSDKDVNKIFPASRLKKNYVFQFKNTDEISIRTTDSVRLNGLLFHADSSKGVIFYLHGNNGALNRWGKIAPVYTGLHYDIFMFDYRGYGKSEGKIRNEKQLYCDVQIAYDKLKTLYPERNIIILGFSIGTGPATMLAATNHPRKLILQAPYYSLSDAVHVLASGLDTLQLPFQLNTYKFVPTVSCPIVIFHGDADKTFYYGSSQKLMKLAKAGDVLITLKGADHSDMEKNPEYLTALKETLQ